MVSPMRMTDLGGPACGVPLVVEEDEVDVWAAETVGSADVLVQQPVDQAAVACGQRSGQHLARWSCCRNGNSQRDALLWLLSWEIKTVREHVKGAR